MFYNFHGLDVGIINLRIYYDCVELKFFLLNYPLYVNQ